MRRRAAGLGLIAAFMALTIVMSCVIAGAAIERGRLPPLEVTADLGALRLITVVTDDATCWRPIRGSAGVLCSTGSIYNPNRYYIAWAELPGGSPGRPRPVYRKLFVLRLPT
jgi:hypothetical protein